MAHRSRRVPSQQSEINEKQIRSLFLGWGKINSCRHHQFALHGLEFWTWASMWVYVLLSFIESVKQTSLAPTITIARQRLVTPKRMNQFLASSVVLDTCFSAEMATSNQNKPEATPKGRCWLKSARCCGMPQAKFVWNNFVFPAISFF